MYKEETKIYYKLMMSSYSEIYCFEKNYKYELFCFTISLWAKIKELKQLESKGNTSTLQNLELNLNLQFF